MDGYPTVLLARDGFESDLVDCLKGSGFHVLEADDWADVLKVVKGHSRPIHVLLTDVRTDADLQILIQRHRPKLLFAFVNTPVNVDDVLAEILQLLGLPLAT